MTGMNPLDWYGGAFLALYAGLFVAAIGVGKLISISLRPAGREMPMTNEDELAVLAGRAPRLAEAVLARMLARGEATIQRGWVVFRGASSASGLERELSQLPSPAKWSAIQHRVRDSAARIEQQLVARGLVMERGEKFRLGMLAAIPLLLLLGLGWAKLQVGIARDRPVGFLVVFLIVTAITVLLRVFLTSRRTKAGYAVLKQAQQRSERLKRAPTTGEMGTAVALFGTAVLVGSPFADLHGMRHGQGDGSGGSGDSGGSSDGGSGCGGGGCGGCGGGGD
jgi:uncharacterized protein (TIGR04222 family)